MINDALIINLNNWMVVTKKQQTMAEYQSTTHPFKRKKNGKLCSCTLHRKIWMEKYGDIPKGHIIHHINGDKQDNRIENLMLISYSDHSKLHWKERRTK